MVTYYSAYEYISTPSDLLVKINRLDAIINAYSDTLLAGATNGLTSEYSLDSGQSKIKTMFRSLKELSDGINALELLREKYIVRYNKLNHGSVVRLVDSKNFRVKNGY